MDEIKLNGFRFKHGGYYYVTGRASGERKWLHLGRDKDKALKRYLALIGGAPDEAAALYAHLRKVYNAAKRRAKVAGIHFELTRDEYSMMVRRSGLCCELTGIPFSMSWAEGLKHRRPYVPSLDRKDSTQPYRETNCRLVLCAVNYALNEWGETVLLKIAAALVDTSPIGTSKEIQEHVATL